MASRRSRRSVFARSSWSGQSGRERLAHLRVEEHRILARLLREHPFGQAGHEHHAERAAARLMRAADEHRAVAVRRRMLVDGAETFAQDVAHFLERDRTDRAHRLQLAEHAQDARGLPQHARRQLLEAGEPVSPGRGRRPRRERVDRPAARTPAGAPDCARRARSAGAAASRDPRAPPRPTAAGYCSARPESRRCHRCGSPPMTADSTISFSHFHGARSVPSTTGACSCVDRRARRPRRRHRPQAGSPARPPAPRFP